MCTKSIIQGRAGSNRSFAIHSQILSSFELAFDVCLRAAIVGQLSAGIVQLMYKYVDR